MEVIRKFRADIGLGSYINNKFDWHHSIDDGYLVIEKVNGTKKLSVYIVNDETKKVMHVLKESSNMLPEIGKIAGKTLGGFVKKALGDNSGTGATAYSINKDIAGLERKYEQHEKENFNLSGIEDCELSFSFSPKTTIDIYPDKMFIDALGISRAEIKDYVLDYTANDKHRRSMMNICFKGSNTALEFADLILDILNGATLIKHEKSW